jgi:hypothetical protein
LNFLTLSSHWKATQPHSTHSPETWDLLISRPFTNTKPVTRAACIATGLTLGEPKLAKVDP